jgi:NTE family protein
LDGSAQRERVTLTDGGIYDNLGLAPLWPDRDSTISVAIPKPDIIIACRAGYGLRLGEPTVTLLGRMTASFYTTLDRTQNAALKRLYDLEGAGKLTAIVLPYLGQADSRLICAPSDLVKREEVDAYPTDFKAMSDVWIEKLSTRGEQVTLAVIKEHHPELLSPAN